MFSGAQSHATKYSVLQKSTKVHGGVSCCVGLHCGVGVIHTTLIFSHGEIDTSLQEGYQMIQDDMVAGSGVQQCIGVCNWVQSCAKGH